MKLTNIIMVNVLTLAAPCFGKIAATTPQMGWNSWNVLKANINQTIIQKTALTLISSGLSKAGYNYLVLDEGWQAYTRDADGRQQVNITKFPSGVPALANYVHELGLKIGLYSDAGIYDCAFFPGSWGNEELDAQTYASWGIDYLKYDNCGQFQAGTHSPADRFLTMGNALKNSGRDIFYSLCQWGSQFPWFWADQLSESYRMSGDVTASFAVDKSGVCKTAYCLNTGYGGVSVLTMIRKMREISRFQAPGSWADMDMLEIGTNTMTELEEQTHFSFWAALKSPLIIGADITNIQNSSLDILLNKEMIAINQDSGGKAISYVPSLSTEGSVQVWSGPLGTANFQHVILALNEGLNSTNIKIALSEIPSIQSTSTSRYKVRDIWAAKDLGIFDTNVILTNVSKHQTKVLMISTIP